jgi:hypothetical protein
MSRRRDGAPGQKCRMSSCNHAFALTARCCRHIGKLGAVDPRAHDKVVCVNARARMPKRRIRSAASVRLGIGNVHGRGSGLTFKHVIFRVFASIIWNVERIYPYFVEGALRVSAQPFSQLLSSLPLPRKESSRRSRGAVRPAGSSPRNRSDTVALFCGAVDIAGKRSRGTWSVTSSSSCGRARCRELTAAAEKRGQIVGRRGQRTPWRLGGA